MATTNKQFDFDSFNKAILNANSGMRLFLAQQLITDVLSVKVRYENDNAPEMALVLKQIKDIRAEDKIASAARLVKQAAREELGNSADSRPNVDDAHLESKASNSADAGKVS